MRKVINSEKAPAPIGPYNHSVQFGNMLFISGQIPFDQATNTLVSGNIQEETKQVMKNLKFILDEAGFDFSHAVKATIFIKNMDDFQLINEVYGEYFEKENAPARECVQVAKLPRNVNVEISMICCK